MLVSQWWNFYVAKFHVLILMSLLECSSLADVAHQVSPVPVLNCELLNGPEPRGEGVLSRRGAFYKPCLKCLSASRRVDAPKRRVEFLAIPLDPLENK